MTERRLECISPSCARLEATHGGGQCGVQWKYWECETKPAWRVYANDKAHLRGDEVCSGKHRVPVTTEVKAFITRMDSCGVRPRHIWSNLRRATDVRAPPLGLPSRQQVSDCVKRLRKKNLTRNTREAVKNLKKIVPVL
ncbi:hypothetical protein PHYSODRAFT_486745 [Phytophthora sojae]|uniref:Uncharacterized protein n=1 Tax=Phytophthora sojae (strain P6497) TaxID=1094619 RepID=G4YRJ2_PHYSP|nr:hypothetical protein PHYSODRAFT_486745 [Phytophthora sojae]EGZ23457.1 hypothetical protein PHYSODRAFT_486745 [Phytophthora sojae]|eukprot:XP_009518745.1 hypothetical protein PHYSODRAFT_486745 [Phytophthora sojae]